MSSQTPQKEAPKSGSPASSSAGSHPAATSSPVKANRSPSPGNNTGSGADPASAGGINPKQVLTEEQKKKNHIASEKKRRNNIREQYDKLAEMIPGMAGQGRSEGRVLEEAVKYARNLVREREKMIEDIKERGGTVDPKLYQEIEKARKVVREDSPRNTGGLSDSQGQSD